MDWVRACKENPKNRTMCNSDFSEAGPFNEMVVMGVLAVRLQALNKVLEWDGENMRFTNIGEHETIKTCIKDGFTIHNGHPSFNKTWTEPVNAIQLRRSLSSTPTARDGSCLICRNKDNLVLFIIIFVVLENLLGAIEP